MKKITLVDVAMKANVSKTTVSLILNNKPINVNEETRKKVLKVAEELNYIPNNIARSLSTKKTNILGVIFPNIENPFFSEIAKAIECTAEALGYTVIICNSNNKAELEEKQIKLLIGQLVDGVILVSGGERTISLKLLKNNKIPFLLLDRYFEEEKGYSGVFCSNEEGIKLGLNYLYYEKNKKNIAFIRGEKGVKTADLRYEYYKKLSKEIGIYDKDLVFEGKFNIVGGMESTEKLLECNKKVDAIFYSSDIMALGGMKILIRNGYKIPNDISILGYDNINISQIIEPELTTISQPIYNMGKEACNLLVNLIDKKIKDKIVMLKPTLIERSTVL